MKPNACNFSQELTTLSSYLKNFAFKLTQDSHNAEDLYQDTALLAYKNRDKFVEGTNFKAWLSTIMRNTFINNFRKKKRHGIVIDTELLFKKETGTVNNEGEEMLKGEELMMLINYLKDEMKQPFLMAYNGYKYHEIAEVMDLPVGTVKSRIFLARKELKNHIRSKFQLSEAEDSLLVQ